MLFRVSDRKKIENYEKQMTIEKEFCSTLCENPLRYYNRRED